MLARSFAGGHWGGFRLSAVVKNAALDTGAGARCLLESLPSVLWCTGPDWELLDPMAAPCLIF